MTENPEDADTGERVVNLTEYYDTQIDIGSSMLEKDTHIVYGLLRMT